MTPAKKNVPGPTPAKQSRTSAVGDRPPQSISIIERTAELEQAMTMRTAKSTVTFARPFRLGALGDQYPAGRYPIETDDELLAGIYFPTHRRATTTMQLIADPMHPGVAEFAMVDPERLAEALAADTERAPVISIDPPQVAL